jgi:hypothetical protein
MKGGVLAVVLATLALLALGAGPANATTPCAKKVLADWLDNDRIDGKYELHCYQQAIDSIPADIRPYSNAADVIRQAMLRAGGRSLSLHKGAGGPGTEPPIAPVASSSSASSVPVPLLVLGGMAIALLVAGGGGYLARRRRVSDE